MESAPRICRQEACRHAASSHQGLISSATAKQPARVASLPAGSESERSGVEEEEEQEEEEEEEEEEQIDGFGTAHMVNSRTCESFLLLKDISYQLAIHWPLIGCFFREIQSPSLPYGSTHVHLDTRVIFFWL